MVESLFAPWRFSYVTTADRVTNGDCVFCRAYASADDAAALTLWRRPRCFALLNLYPYTSGHCMIAPIAHGGDIVAVDEATLADIMVGARDLVAVLTELYRPHGFNLGFNVGQAGGAGIAEHLHLHVVPRWRADHNFMAVIGDTRVIPETVETTYARIRCALGADRGSGTQPDREGSS